jgi:hypothetical protein
MVRQHELAFGQVGCCTNACGRVEVWAHGLEGLMGRDQLESGCRDRHCPVLNTCSQDQTRQSILQNLLQSQLPELAVLGRFVIVVPVRACVSHM